MIDLRKGDCLELMKSIPSGSIDAIITDPPYGTTACKWDSVINFDLMWEQLNRIIKPNGAIVLFGSEPFSSALRMSNIKNYKYDWIWDKEKSTNFMQLKRQPARVVENIIVFNTTQYNPQMVIAEAKNKRPRKQKQDEKHISESETYGKIKRYVNANHNEDLRYPKNIINIKSTEKECNNINRVHPTQKPVALMEYLMRTYTNENETVLDFTMGSGSTGVACVNTNRNFIGIEKYENYFDIATERINKLKQNK
tara:strand:+ start:317 stop:1075 length:759 start_codon:yes stop_codon:yes gene_type:complete